MSDNPYESPQNVSPPEPGSDDEQRFQPSDFASAGCSFVAIFPLTLVLCGGLLGFVFFQPRGPEVQFREYIILVAVILLIPLLLASLSAWQALYQARRRRIRRRKT